MGFIFIIIKGYIFWTTSLPIGYFSWMGRRYYEGLKSMEVVSRIDGPKSNKVYKAIIYLGIGIRQENINSIYSSKKLQLICIHNLSAEGEDRIMQRYNA